MSLSQDDSVDCNSPAADDNVFEESISSDSEYNRELVYSKRNLVIGMNDEIIASNNFVDTSDTSSIASFLAQPRNDNYSKPQPREVQAEKYLERLEKVKTKVVKRKLNLEDYNNQLKKCKGYV